MKLSIIIPVYNAEKYIEECLDSIISEIDEQVEVLLLDDGSTDHSYQMIKNYERKNIRIFHHENHGVSYTRNQGGEEAAGEFLMVVVADATKLPCWK
uniref:glycosyltransferase family 2 protein n=1 Tax=Eshraghiella crossota TaxID=45851 RepID=UPI004029BBEB